MVLGDLLADEALFHRSLAYIMLGTGVVTLISLLFFQTAPYGRYSTAKGWGPLLPARVAWTLMESPCWVIGSGLLFHRLQQEGPLPLPNLLLTSFFLTHYLYRALLYPIFFAQNSSPMPASVCALAFSFCCVNGYLQMRNVTHFMLLPEEELHTPFFVPGLLLAISGLAVNILADQHLLSLKKASAKERQAGGVGGYKIPTSPLFSLVSCPNFTGEMVEWFGFYLATPTSIIAFSFFFFTVANLLPRAISHHKFYLEKFEDYPKNRKAAIPFLL